MSAWQRLGFLGNPAGSAPWARTHAALPALGEAGADRADLFVSSRDASGRARIGRCRLTLGPAPALSDLDAEPVLDLGTLGAFDDSGVTMSCVVAHGSTDYLYYTGWTRGVSVPFYLFVGLAVSTDGGRTFERASKAPILDRSDDDPYLAASPFVMRDGGIWRMWYISGTSWAAGAGAARHYYHIKYTESADGVRWGGPRRVAIDYGAPDEHAFARPCVARDGNRYRMWYSYRGARYRIGGAESSDGVAWIRRDRDMGLEPGTAAWENEMVAYPWVFESGGRRHMVYNGNDYGRTGLGLAVWQ